MKDEYKFKGWDWTELTPLLGMEEEYERKIQNAKGSWIEAEGVLLDKMRCNIVAYPDKHSVEETQQFIKHLRAFLQVIVDFGGYYTPLYQGILNVEHDEVFLQVYSWNLEHMWT